MENKLNIVIAEDDQDDAEFIHSSFLESGQFNSIHLVEDGEELIHFLNSAFPPPDLILMDLNMPKKNGYDVLLEISQNLNHQKIPVFIYSTSTNPSYMEKCYELGAKAFLVKPFCLEDYKKLPYKMLDLFYEIEQENLK